MSGLIAILGETRDAKAAIVRGVAAAPGRGSVQAEWVSAQATLCYQGDDAAREFCVSDTSVCISLGWPYQVDAQNGQCLNLSASDIIALFSRHRDLNSLGIFGQYVIALYCIQSTTLFVVRDVLGSLPLHWSTFANGSIHACDVRQIAAAKSSPLSLSLAALTCYHQQLALPASTDLYRDVHLHLPGATSAISAQETQLRILRPAPTHTTVLEDFASKLAPKDAVVQLIEAVSTSIAMCRRDKSLAISLSGGMDSTLLWLCANQKSSTDLLSVSCAFPGKRCDESEKISAVLALSKGNHQRMALDNPAFSRWQTELFSATDYVPFPANQIGLQMAKTCQQMGFSQLLDGNGGDELFDWNLLDLAQTAKSSPAFKQLLLGLCRSSNGPRVLALRHMLKRVALGRLRQTINDRLACSRKMLSPSTDRAFYLAAEQIASSTGVALFNPLRDLRLLKMLAAWLPCGSFQNGHRRGLQANAIFKLSGDSIVLRREQKVNFDEFAQVPWDAAMFRDQPDLGTAKLANFAGLMPRFLKHKVEVEGVLLSP